MAPRKRWDSYPNIPSISFPYDFFNFKFLSNCTHRKILALNSEILCAIIPHLLFFAVPYQNFRHCETKKISAKTFDTPPSFPKFFRYREFSEEQHRRVVPLPNCSALRDKIFSTETFTILRLFFKTFSLPELLWNTAEKGCSPNQIFGTVRQKTMDWNFWYSFPLVSKLFRSQKFSEKQHWRVVPPINFSALWDKKTLDWNFWYSFPSFSKLSHCQKLSETQHRRIVPLPKFSALWDKKLSTKTLDTPPSFPKLFRYRKFSETQHRRVVPQPNCSAMRDKKNRLKHLILFPPLFKTFSLPEIFWKAALKSCSPTKFFGTVRQKTLDWNFWYSFPLFFKAFGAKNSLKHSTEAMFPTKIFGTVRQKNFPQKLLILPLLFQNFFATGNFLKNSTEGLFPYQIVRHWETKFFRLKLLPSSASFSKHFRCQNFSETQQRRVVPPTKFSALWDKKLWTETFHTPSPSFQNFFAARNFLKSSTEELFPQ